MIINVFVSLSTVQIYDLSFMYIYLHSASSCAQSRAGRGHNVVLLGKTLFITVSLLICTEIGSVYPQTVRAT